MAAGDVPDDSVQWAAADAAFDRLLDLPESERDAAVERLAPDPKVAARLRALLRAHRRHGALELPAAPLEEAGPEPPEDALCGRVIGGWTLGRELGRGGMSVVYEASRGEGRQCQRAALKLLTLGALAARGRGHVRREHAILARLNHAHIAHLYDAGETDDGTPYLVMERVEGQPINAWCDANALDVRGRVRLLLAVCEAITYAHRHLVVHADLKPSNVLVDEQGHVRVLDFGIGRLLDEDADEQTRSQWHALTPQYAAPEQFDGAGSTTAADVFGLGALLYCLLAGRAPRQAPGDPLTLPSRAAREAGATRRAQAIGTDLDRVVLKALAEVPERRYVSAEALGNDLNAWLDGRPVAARRGGRGYRMRKFISRHRLPVAAAAACLLALLAGVVTTTWQARRAALQAERAVAVKDFLAGILQSADPTRTDGRDPPASELLRRGAQRINSDLAARPALRAELLALIGHSQFERGLTEDARRSLDTVLSLHASGAVVDAPAHANALADRAMVAYELGDIDGALARLRRATALLGDAPGLLPARAAMRARLADMLVVDGDKPQEAEAIARDLLARLRTAGRTEGLEYALALRTLGRAADRLGREDEGIARLREASRAARGLKDPTWRAAIDNDLGVALFGAGRYAQAQPVLERTLAQFERIYGDARPDTIAVRANLAALYLRMGQAPRAVAMYNDIVARLRARGTAGSDLAIDLGWLAVADYHAGATGAALAAAEDGWATAQQLDQGGRAKTAWLASVVGLLRFELGRPDPDALLQRRHYDCRTLDGLSPMTRAVCVARALRTTYAPPVASVVAPRCTAPTATPPRELAALDGVDRRWWASWWLLRVHCGGGDRARAADAVHALARDAKPPFPAQLLQRLQQARLLGAGQTGVRVHFSPKAKSAL